MGGPNGPTILDLFCGNSVYHTKYLNCPDILSKEFKFWIYTESCSDL